MGRTEKETYITKTREGKVLIECDERERKIRREEENGETNRKQ